MIYFNNNKQAYAYEIPNYIATVEDNIWEEYASTDKWDIIDGVFTDITDTEEYKEKKAKEEAKRISNLKCTKRVFVLMLEKMGLDYFEQIEPLINNNRQAKLEWELCVELERSNNLLDILATELGVTSRQLDLLFQYANGEDVKLEVVNG
jgi:hypothetical protein